MNKKFFGFLGLSGILCAVCCAIPLISIAGLTSAGVLAGLKGSITYFVAGAFAVLGLTLFIKRNQISTCATSCEPGCGCKPKQK